VSVDEGFDRRPLFRKKAKTRKDGVNCPTQDKTGLEWATRGLEAERVGL